MDSRLKRSGMTAAEAAFFGCSAKYDHLGRKRCVLLLDWIPAFAGMTAAEAAKSKNTEFLLPQE